MPTTETLLRTVTFENATLKLEAATGRAVALVFYREVPEAELAWVEEGLLTIHDVDALADWCVRARGILDTAREMPPDTPLDSPSPSG